MAKQKSRKGKGSYAAYATEDRMQKNRARKLARHLKAHPNDEQAAKAPAVGTKRKPAGKNGHPAQKFYSYDGAGRKTLMPSFTPAFLLKETK
tara:strand:- start:395 stop:670 length:276 start_codon:yes stop_codon:yes gene_type:complete